MAGSSSSFSGRSAFIVVALVLLCSALYADAFAPRRSFGASSRFESVAELRRATEQAPEASTPDSSPSSSPDSTPDSSPEQSIPVSPPTAPDLHPSQVTAFRKAAEDMPAFNVTWRESALLDACRRGSSPTGIRACDANGFVTRFQLGILPGPDAGILSPWFSNLTELTFFSLQLGNGVNGTYPSEWSALTKVASLTVTGGRLTGGIPDEWSSMTALTSIHLQFMGFRSADQPETFGTIGSWVGRLSSIILRGINFGPTADMPSALYTSSIKTLSLTDVIFSGVIPNSLTMNTAIEQLMLGARQPGSENSFIPGQNKTLPSDWSTMTSLEYLSLEGFAWDGSLPRIPSRLAYFTASNLPSITGSIPSHIMNTPSLEYLSLRDLPRISGSLPAPSSTIRSNLTYVDLYRLSVSGILSNDWFTIPYIQGLSMEDMTFAPTQLTDLPAGRCGLQSLFLSSVQLSGTFPSALASACPNLTYIAFTGNYLTGTLPNDWSALNTGLETLQVRNNFMSGTIPSSIKWMDYEHGVTLDVTNNHFSGTLPLSFYQRRFQRLDLADNNLNVCPPVNETVLDETLAAHDFDSWGQCIIGPQENDICECSSSFAPKCRGFAGCSPELPPQYIYTEPNLSPGDLPPFSSSVPPPPPSPPPTTPQAPSSTPSSTPSAFPAPAPRSPPTGAGSALHAGVSHVATILAIALFITLL